MTGIRVWQQSHGIMYVRAALAYGCPPLPAFHVHTRKRVAKRAWKRAVHLDETKAIYRILGP